LYGRPVARYSLPGDNVYPEGITEGGGTIFFVGSMGDGTIYRGDTASGGTKPAKLETGLVVQVPLFVNQGETIKVDTRNGTYLERV